MFNPVFEAQPTQVGWSEFDETIFGAMFGNPKKTSTEKYFWHDSFVMFST